MIQKSSWNLQASNAQVQKQYLRVPLPKITILLIRETKACLFLHLLLLGWRKLWEFSSKTTIETKWKLSRWDSRQGDNHHFWHWNSTFLRLTQNQLYHFPCPPKILTSLMTKSTESQTSKHNITCIEITSPTSKIIIIIINSMLNLTSLHYKHNSKLQLHD